MRTLVIIGAIFCAIPLIAGSGKKVVCYWNSFSVRNVGLKGMFAVKDIDPKICTHLIYTYIRFTSSIFFFPDYNEDDLAAFKNLKSQNSNIKLLIGVGGPRQGSQIPSTIASTPTNRNEMAQKVKKFIDDYGFDGCDFDWQWPGQGSGASATDKDNYVLLLQKLKETLGASKIFSISVAPRQEDIDKSYDIQKIHQHVDFINLNTYNFHGVEGETVTAFHSAYRKSPNDLTKEGEWNAISVVENWLNKGVPSAKLTLGIPTYGKSFTLTEIVQIGVGAPVSGLGLKSEYLSDNTNIIPYTEICHNILMNTRWTSYWNSAQFAPYAVFNANQWVGYDDLQVVRTKIHLALNNNLGGLNYATIDKDDFTGQCSGNKFPLIRLGYDAMVNDIIPPNPTETTTSTPRSTTTSTTSTTSTSTSSSTTTKPPEVPTTTTAAVSRDPDSDDKSTSTEPITEPITTTEPITEPITTTTELITEPITTTTEPITEPITTRTFTDATTTTFPKTTTTTTKKSTVPKTTVTRTTTTRASTSENPTPPITPGVQNPVSTTKKNSEDEATTSGATSILTTQEVLSTVTEEEITSTTKEVTTTKKLLTTSTKAPTPPVTPSGSTETTQKLQSTQTSVQVPEPTVIIQQSTPRQNGPAMQTTSIRTTQFIIPTPPVTPASRKVRSADFPKEKSFVCPEENGKFRNPEDCTSYFVCVRNVPYKFYCNYDKVFDELNNNCDHQLKLSC